MILIVCCAFGAAVLTDRAIGQEADTANSPAEILSLRVRVTDNSGAAIKDAMVTPVGMRSRLERGSSWSWVANLHGKQPHVLTDADGIAILKCPKYVIEKLEVGEIILRVTHDDYVTFNDNCSVDDDPAEVTLQAGRLIVVSAIDGESKKAVTSDLHAILSGSGSASPWGEMSDGMLMSPTVDLAQSQLRLVSAPVGGPVKFSRSIDLDKFGAKRRVRLRDVEVYSGTRIEGVIDRAVPRPINNGTVSLWVVTGLEFDDWQKENIWSDWTNVNPDGTFVFESVPRGNVCQLIAVCDGWQCEPPTAQEIRDIGLKVDMSRWLEDRTIPQVTMSDSTVISPMIRMQKTATCRIRVIDSDGQPVRGAQVEMWPNQIWLTGGSQMLGSGSSSLAWKRLSVEQRKNLAGPTGRKLMKRLRIHAPGPERYSTTTDQDGLCEIHTLPGAEPGGIRQESIDVQHARFEQPIGGDQNLRRETVVNLIRGEVTTVTIQMLPLGSKLIGE